MYYGQLGRSFSAENGWVTKSVTPFSMSQIEEVTPGANPRVKLHPELIHAPAYPMVLCFSSACLKRQARNLF